MDDDADKEKMVDDLIKAQLRGVEAAKFVMNSFRQSTFSALDIALGLIYARKFFVHSHPEILKAAEDLFSLQQTMEKIEWTDLPKA